MTAHRADVRLLPPSVSARPVPVDRGRMLTPDDVVAMLPPKRNGQRLTRKHVLAAFLPEKRHKLGALVWWYESDVRAHLDGDTAADHAA